MTRRLQRDRVFQLMYERGENGITRQDAAAEIGCFELASRIGELEAEGAVVHRSKGTGQNRYGDPVRYTRYVLMAAPSPLAERALGIDLADLLRGD